MTSLQTERQGGVGSLPLGVLFCVRLLLAVRAAPLSRVVRVHMLREGPEHISTQVLSCCERNTWY